MDLKLRSNILKHKTLNLTLRLKPDFALFVSCWIRSNSSTNLPWGRLLSHNMPRFAKREIFRIK